MKTNRTMQLYKKKIGKKYFLKIAKEEPFISFSDAAANRAL